MLEIVLKYTLLQIQSAETAAASWTRNFALRFGENSAIDNKNAIR